MQKKYIEAYAGHLINFQPMPTFSGKYVADAKVVDMSPSGYRRSFSALGTFDSEDKAAEFALEWVKSWINHNRLHSARDDACEDDAPRMCLG